MRDPPVYIKPRVRLHESTEIYFFNKELAQTRIVIEFAGQEYSEKDTPSAQLFNYYFGRGMSGVATQELRESRALAYIVEARYVLGSRRNQQNRMKFVIETQSDKTVEALHAALELIDDGALTPERFSDTQESVINRYRIAKVGFRDVIGVVRKWGRLGLSPDPRRERFRKIKTMQIDTLRGFHQKEIANHPKLISIVGDKNKIDMEALQKIGRITYIDLDDIFVD